MAVRKRTIILCAYTLSITVSGLLHTFFEGIARDPRISCGHIGLYAALLQCWAAQQYRQPLMVFSHQVIGLAKVSSRDTYFRYIRQLSEYGYIKYEPSLSRKQPSSIYLDEAGRQ
ncbi:hypothetical protein [Dyadobacter crusticola]|uniref:hypothetical protein n=1 Tax=Dyadobacter crusticola TaxID=292407 RepID=UPI00196A13A2|nr:hypothetical protein [Dyadobacter crusticola]